MYFYLCLYYSVCLSFCLYGVIKVFITRRDDETELRTTVDARRRSVQLVTMKQTNDDGDSVYCVVRDSSTRGHWSGHNGQVD